MLLHRVLSAVVGVPFLIFTVWFSGWVLALVTTVLIMVGIVEYSKLTKHVNIRTWLPAMVAGALLFVFSALFPLIIKIEFVFITLLWIYLFLTITRPAKFGFIDAAAGFFGTIYIGWLLSHLILLRSIDNGFYYLLLAFVATWLTDTMAYFAGRFFGKRKLAPAISPKKTVEGSVGGLVGALTGGLLLGYLVPTVAMFHAGVLGLLIGIVGQLGDLVESAMKRKAGIKDSGSLIPGHGGVLDRFDSLFFTIPLVYYYVQVFIIN